MQYEFTPTHAKSSERQAAATPRSDSGIQSILGTGPSLFACPEAAHLLGTRSLSLTAKSCGAKIKVQVREKIAAGACPQTHTCPRSLSRAELRLALFRFQTQRVSYLLVCGSAESGSEIGNQVPGS